MSDQITLYGATTIRTVRPLWVAEELGLDYALEPIGPRTGETQTPEYTRISAKQKVPVLVHGDVTLSESLAICRYLIELTDGDLFYQGTDLASRAKLDAWCCYLYGELDETALYVMRRHRDLSAIYGEAPAAVESSARYAERHLNIVSDTLKGSPTVMREGFSVADILLVSCLDWAHAYEVAIPAGLADYHAAHRERPAYQRAWAANFPTGKTA